MRGSRPARRATQASLVLTLVIATTVVASAPASAGWNPPGTAGVPCSTAADIGRTVYNIASVNVDPTLTHFMAINISAGTTGQRTETLNVLAVVSTSVNGNFEIDAEAGFLLFKVSSHVSFSVQQTTSSTSSETTSMTWAFNQPGYYGLYKGTRAVRGSYHKWTCDGYHSPGFPPLLPAQWVVGWKPGPFPMPAPKPFTTFANMEAGTISCDDSVPQGSLREKALLQLGCASSDPGGRGGGPEEPV